MNHINIAIELNRNRDVFREMLHGVDDAQVKWKPLPEKWCMLEIVCHLYDEEVKDFRARVQQVLQDPALPLDPIDPVGWVQSRGYMQQDFEHVLHTFLAERMKSVNFLNSLNNPHWDNTYLHPKLGPMPASLFLHNWLAHDYHHIRQINELKYLYLKTKSKDPLSYAGEW
jgi:hypothetical protein